MSKEYPNSGSLFMNKRKNAPNHKDMEGYIEIDNAMLETLLERRRAGKDLRMDLAVWNKTSKKTGEKFFSISVSAPWEPNARPQPPPRPTRSQNPYDDDLPF